KSKDQFYETLCDDIENRRSLAPVLAALVRRRKDNEQKLSREEKQVLKIYEDEALGKSERFDTLERIARRVNDMEERYRDSFVKQLGNIRSKDRMLDLLRTFAKAEKTSLHLSVEEIRVLDESRGSDVVSLLY